MFLRIYKKKKGNTVYEYADIAERHRVNGVQKTSILNYLGTIKNKSDLDRYMNELELALEREKLKHVPKGEFSLLPSLEFGVVYAAVSLMDMLSITKVLKKNVQVYLHLIMFMVASRIIHPSSDMAQSNWQRGHITHGSHWISIMIIYIDHWINS